MIETVTGYFSEYGLLTGAVFVAVLIGVSFIKSAVKRVIQLVILVIALVFIGGYLLTDKEVEPISGVEVQDGN